MQQLLQLDHSLGFVQLGCAATPAAGGAAEAPTGAAAEKRVAPARCLLWSAALRRAAVRGGVRVASGGLLQNESVAAYRARSAELLARLNEFVGRHADADEVAAAAAGGGVAYPVHDLEFDGATLRVLPEEVCPILRLLLRRHPLARAAAALARRAARHARLAPLR